MDEIVVIDDYSDDEDTLDVLSENSDIITLYKHALNKDFGAHKQFGNEKCNGDFIFQIDADEYFSDGLLYNLKIIATEYSDTDLFTVPRINILRGLTMREAQRWGWRVTIIPDFEDTEDISVSSEWYSFLKDNNLIVRDVDTVDGNYGTREVTYKIPIINFPDRQTRFYRNSPTIRWERPLHEYVKGFDVISHIPDMPEYCIIHDKTLDRQLNQNMFYVQNFSRELNVRK
jgi:glycosyltransferase involved in cell wall biosynthesis